MQLHERDELATLFERFHALLSQAQKQYLQLYLFEDLTISEIAEEAATTRQAVSDGITKGARKLRDMAVAMDQVI